MKAEYLRLIPGLRSNFREIHRLRERVDELKEQRQQLKNKRQGTTPTTGAGKGASKERAERIEWISGQVPFNVVDRSIHISLQHRYLFVETPKVGCSSIKKTLIRIELAAPELELDNDEIHLRKLSPLLQPSQLSNNRHLTRSGALQRFVFVRNPYSRTLSAYLQLVRNPRPARSRMLEKCGLSQLDSDGIIEFPEFLKAVSTQDISSMDPHWRPQYHQCFFDQIEFDFIGRFENFDADLARCVSSFGSDQFIGHHAPHSTSASEKLAKYYSPQTLAQVNDICRVDFEKLGYEMLGSLPADPAAIQSLLPAR